MALSQATLGWLAKTLFSTIAFALGKLEHTLPTACGGSSSSKKASHHRRSRGREVFLRCAMRLCNSSQDQRALGVPRRHALLSLHASTVAVAGCRSGVTEGSPGCTRLLCNAAYLQRLFAARTGPGTVCWRPLTVKVGSRVVGCRANANTACMYVTGLEGTRVVNNGTRARQADCVARMAVRCKAASVGVSGAVPQLRSSARIEHGSQQIPAHRSLAATQPGSTGITGSDRRRKLISTADQSVELVVRLLLSRYPILSSNIYAHPSSRAQGLQQHLASIFV